MAASTTPAQRWMTCRTHYVPPLPKLRGPWFRQPAHAVKASRYAGSRSGLGIRTGVSMQVAIGTYEHTKGLKDGSVSAPGMAFEFVEVSPITRAFRGMAAEQAYDISEMALATYMLARVYDKPIVGLPIVLVRSSLLPGLVTASGSPVTDPTAA